MFNTAVSNNTILVLYGLAVLNRMRFAFSDVSQSIKTKTILFSVFAAFIYFILLLIFVFGKDWVPDLGLNIPFLHQIGYFENLTSTGIFSESPKVPMAIGFTYYVLLAFVETWLVRSRIKI